MRWIASLVALAACTAAWAQQPEPEDNEPGDDPPASQARPGPRTFTVT